MTKTATREHSLPAKALLASSALQTLRSELACEQKHETASVISEMLKLPVESLARLFDIVRSL